MDSIYSEGFGKGKTENLMGHDKEYLKGDE